ncbi:protein EMBRYO SAC DEVELOPMENT ARREST 3, chloroplastic [Ananas comosus]|uniref:Protein EMBRYO SAC DEVELOPMENT ARREST 3, chloroplastic n=1 Tax=Ananas comosus TaxID=4615 RepID=A0A6P5GT36_ANACO|nr:protein EMBRYO SAC DEVELOPMENT ARREST 3, chloroplastic [Ananas comosus]
MRNVLFMAMTEFRKAKAVLAKSKIKLGQTNSKKFFLKFLILYFYCLQVSKGCKTCGGKGAIECPGCKGTGKNKKNGNIFERWKCFDCQGFGLKSCPSCGKGGLTPEQRGER